MLLGKHLEGERCGRETLAQTPSRAFLDSSSSPSYPPHHQIKSRLTLPTSLHLSCCQLHFQGQALTAPPLPHTRPCFTMQSARWFKTTMTLYNVPLKTPAPCGFRGQSEQVHTSYRSGKACVLWLCSPLLLTHCSQFPEKAVLTPASGPLLFPLSEMLFFWTLFSLQGSV